MLATRWACPRTGRRACSRSAPTPTTSRSAPAGPSCAWSTSARPASRLGRPHRRRSDAGDGGARERRGAPRRPGAAPRSTCAASATAIFPYARRRDQGGASTAARDGLAARPGPRRTAATTPTRTTPVARADLAARSATDSILEYEIPKWDGDLGTAEPVRAARRGRPPTARSTHLLAALPVAGRPTPGSPPTRSARSLRLRGIEAGAADRPRRGVHRAASSSSDLRSSNGAQSLRVLVTGHLGYIGTVLCRASARRATRSWASTPTSTATARSARRPAVPTSRRSTRPARRRRPADLEGFDADRPPRGPVQRPARRPGRRS